MTVRQLHAFLTGDHVNARKRGGAIVKARLGVDVVLLILFSTCHLTPGATAAEANIDTSILEADEDSNLHVHVPGSAEFLVNNEPVALRSQLRQLNESNFMLQGELAQATSLLAAATSTLQDMSTEVQELRASVSQQQHRTNHLHDFEDTVQGLSKKMADLEAENRQLSNTTRELQAQFSVCKAAQPEYNFQIVGIGEDSDSGCVYAFGAMQASGMSCICREGTRIIVLQDDSYVSQDYLYLCVVMH